MATGQHEKIPVIDYRQYCRVRRLVHECCNDDCGNCLALDNKNYIRAWKRYCEANGIPPTTLYELRHTYVSINKEMPEGLKKMAIGHSEDMDTEGTYSHAMAGDMEKAANYTGEALKIIIVSKK